MPLSGSPDFSLIMVCREASLQCQCCRSARVLACQERVKLNANFLFSPLILTTTLTTHRHDERVQHAISPFDCPVEPTAVNRPGEPTTADWRRNTSTQHRACIPAANFPAEPRRTTGIGPAGTFEQFDEAHQEFGAGANTAHGLCCSDERPRHDRILETE